MTRPNDLDELADAIARATPFSGWPRETQLRLAAASTVSSHRSGATLVVGGRRCVHLTVVVDGTALSTVSSPGGRRVTFKIDATSRSYGVLPLIDGQVTANDLIADGPVTVVRIPHAAIRAELAQTPALWQSLAADVAERARRYTEQLKQFVFDAPLVRAASLLLALAAKSDKDDESGPVAIDLRLPQERLAEMLGTSRQWATAMVRELSDAGLVEWRYGRVTVLDVKALRKLAASGINAMGQPVANPGRQRNLDQGALQPAVT